MEVATLTAVLEAEIRNFETNMKVADTLLGQFQKETKETQEDVEGLVEAIKLIQLSNRQVMNSIQNLMKMQKSLGMTKDQAEELKRELDDIYISAATASKSGAAAKAIENQLDEITEKAVKAKVALESIGGVEPGYIRAYGPNFGRRAFVAPPVGGPSAPQMQPTNYEGGTDIARYLHPDLITLNRTFSNTNDSMDQLKRVLAEKYPVYTPGMGPQTKEQYLAQNATPLPDRRLVTITENIPPREIDRDIAGFGQGDIAGATRYLRSRGITFDPGALGGLGRFRTGGRSHDALLAAALGLESTGPVRRLLGTLGWGSGQGIHIPGFGIVGGAGGRGGFGLFGRNIFGGMAGFGTPLGLAGFGAERALFSSLGILGSFGGGILGGGVLGMGALGTFAVGAGTNMAGMGQAAGDIHTVSSDLGKLNDAIQQYGKNSTQAAQAQSQLNQDLKGFSPVARNAVLAAAQTSQQFKALFDKFTGPAEKIGAQIINQGMQVGEKFLPTIGRFAHQNMLILQSGLQPFFAWLQKGGNQNQVIQDVNKLNAAIQAHGVNSTQAAAANERLMQAQKGVGGLGLFTNLEQVFQKNFPTAIHAGEQGFELFMKTIDLAAQHLGHFMQSLNSFFTRMNNQDFGKWAVMIEKLIGLFHSWFGMFVSFGKLLFDIFRPAVGLGKAFADLMTQIFNQVGKYINQKGTQNILHQLFSVHLVQLIKDIGGLLMALLPLVENIASAFIQIEARMAKWAGYVIGAIRDVFNVINKIGGGGLDKLLGWAIAFRIIYAANKVLLGGVLGLLRTIPLIGSLFGTGASEATTAVGKVTESVDAAAATIVGAVERATIAVQNLIREFLGIGPAAEKSAAEVDAAMASETGAVGGAGLAGGMLGRFGLVGFKGRALAGGSLAIGGLIASQLVQSMFPGRGGHAAGNVLAGAGIGAGVGTLVGMPWLGAGAGALAGGLIDLIHHGPSAAQQLNKMAQAAQNFGRQARIAAVSGDKLSAISYRKARSVAQNQEASIITQITAATKEAAKSQADLNKKSDQYANTLNTTNTGLQKDMQSLNQWYHITKGAAASSNANTVALAQWIEKMQLIEQAVEKTNPQLARAINQLIQLATAIHKLPSHKTIEIVLRAKDVGFRVGPNGDLIPTHTTKGAFGGARVSGGGGGPAIDLTLPSHIKYLLALAAAGHYSQKKADQAAYNFYQKQLDKGGLTSAQRMKLLQQESQYYSALYGKPGGIPKTGLPPGKIPVNFLDKQQQESAKARIDINKGQYAAALRLLNLEKRQLDAMLKTTKSQRERTRILNQLASVSSDIKSAKQGLTGVSPNSYQIPLALQLAMAKADALAALNPNLQGPTSQQYKLAVEAKKAAMKAINSHSLSLKQLIDAWNVVGQMNQIIAQKLTNKLNTYHVASTDAVTDMVKGLTAAQEMQLRELMAQRDAHRGYLPNPNGAVAVPHHRRHRATPPIHYPPPPPGRRPNDMGGNVIIHGNVILHGVQSKSELWAEMKRLDRQNSQRAGGRR